MFFLPSDILFLLAIEILLLLEIHDIIKTIK